MTTPFSYRDFLAPGIDIEEIPFIIPCETLSGGTLSRGTLKSSLSPEVAAAIAVALSELMGPRSRVSSLWAADARWSALRDPFSEVPSARSLP